MKDAFRCIFSVHITECCEVTKMLTKEKIYEQLKIFGFAVGKPVLVHTSLKAVGEIDGGGQTLLDCLIDYFTQKDGLFCVPTHTWNTGSLDMTKSETCIGVLPNLAAADPRGTRTPHPSHSMAVFGKSELVAEFVKGEEKVTTPASPHGCYGKIYDMDGHIMLLGVGHNKNTYLHCVEEMLNVPNRLSENPGNRTVIDKNGTVRKVFTHGHHACGIPDVSANYIKYEPAFRYHGCIVDGTLGNAPVQMCSARRMKDVVELVDKRRNGAELLSDNSPLDEKLYK